MGGPVFKFRHILLAVVLWLFHPVNLLFHKPFMLTLVMICVGFGIGWYVIPLLVGQGG